MATTLTTIVDAYLADESFLADWNQTAANRDASVGRLRAITQEFIDQKLDLSAFREAIDRALRNDPAQQMSDWGARGTGFLMELNKLVKYHPHEDTERELRQLLNGLNASNLGQRIETLHRFLNAQRQHFIGNRNALMSPGNTAFFLSLFAFWLNPSKPPHIYYLSLRQGCRELIGYGLLQAAPGLVMDSDKVVVTNAEQHQALEKTLDTLGASMPALRHAVSERYWAEAFFYWFLQQGAQMIIDDAGADMPMPATIVTITHEPLQATPAPLLQRLINDLRRHILIDEQTVRDIYYALLAGHVILTGPPGTGKTELARLLPEILWQSEEPAASSSDPYANPLAMGLTTRSAYTTTVVTATDEWSVRTLIGGLVPQVDATGQVRYRVQPGHLTQAILENWALRFDQPTAWSNPERISIQVAERYDRADATFRGRWLVIDEFNRAPIDIAFGEALTALGSGTTLRVPIDGGSAELPMPQDFRIIGTLNTFDRTYLNRISEALKRRFSFIEINPPGRDQRAAEQGIVLYKALRSIQHLSTVIIENNAAMSLDTVVTIQTDTQGLYTIKWWDPTQQNPLSSLFDAIWDLFELIRIYRKLGTAQAIGFTRQALIEGVLGVYSTREAWEAAFDRALCATIADQLQVLLPDELKVITDYLAGTLTMTSYEALLDTLSERRRSGQQLAVVGVTGLLDPSIIQAALHLNTPPPHLPLLERRLNSFMQERGL